MNKLNNLCEVCEKAAMQLMYSEYVDYFFISQIFMTLYETYDNDIKYTMLLNNRLCLIINHINSLIDDNKPKQKIGTWEEPKEFKGTKEYEIYQEVLNGVKSLGEKKIRGNNKLMEHDDLINSSTCSMILKIDSLIEDLKEKIEDSLSNDKDMLEGNF